MPLATWLDVSAVAAPNRFATGEAPANPATADDGLWSGYANGSSAVAGFTYTKKDKNGSALTLWKTYTISITAPGNTLGGNTYAYADPTTGAHYTQDDIRKMLETESVDVTIQRQSRYTAVDGGASYAAGSYYKLENGVYSSQAVTPETWATLLAAGLYTETGVSRAKFFGLTSGASVSEPSAAGSTSITDTTTGYSLANINAAGKSYTVELKFGLYVEGNDASDDAIVDTSSVFGDFKVSISHHTTA